MNLQKTFNNFLFLTKLISYKFFAKTCPATVIFNLTNRCNQSCLHCYASYYKRKKEDELSTKDIKDILVDLKKNGCLRVTFSGGEPLLRADIEEILRFSKSLGLITSIYSNGYLVKKNLEVLKNVDSLGISLDGKPEHHDLLRKKGSGETAIKAIHEAHMAKIPTIINMVINKYDLKDIDFVLELAKKEKAFVQFSLVIDEITKKGQSTFKPEKNEFMKAINIIIEKKKNKEPILLSKEAYEKVIKNWGKPFLSCPSGRIFSIIDTNGVLWPCPHLIEKTKAKNVLDSGVNEAWETAKKFNCAGCYQAYHYELSLLMNLNLRVLWNYFKLNNYFSK